MLHLLSDTNGSGCVDCAASTVARVKFAGLNASAHHLCKGTSRHDKSRSVSHRWSQLVLTCSRASSTKEPADQAFWSGSVRLCPHAQQSRGQPFAVCQVIKPAYADDLCIAFLYDAAWQGAQVIFTDTECSMQPGLGLKSSDPQTKMLFACPVAPSKAVIARNGRAELLSPAKVHH